MEHLEGPEGVCTSLASLNMRQPDLSRESSVLQLVKLRAFFHTVSYFGQATQAQPHPSGVAMYEDCNHFVRMILDLRQNVYTVPEALASIHALRPVAIETAARHGYNFSRISFSSALNKDDTEHLQLLEQFLEIKSAKDTILTMRGAPAERLMSFLLWVVREWPFDDLSREDEARWTRFRMQVRRITVRLAEASLQPPPSLYLEGVYFDTQAPRHSSRSGSYAVVHRGWRRVPGASGDIEVAIKLFDSSWAGGFVDDLHYMQTVMREIALLSSLKHPNICPLLGVVHTVNSPRVALVLPWRQYGKVTEYLVSPQINVCHIGIVTQVACGLAYLHAEGIVHCDLHPGNVLVDSNGCAQLADFGLSNFSDSTSATATLSRTGATRYKAPEIHVAEAGIGEVRHTNASDVFSLGMVVWHIYSGQHPFHDLRPQAARSQIIDGQTPSLDFTEVLIPDTLRVILRACWSREPKSRPSASSVTLGLEDKP